MGINRRIEDLERAAAAREERPATGAISPEARKKIGALMLEAGRQRFKLPDPDHTDEERYRVAAEVVADRGEISEEEVPAAEKVLKKLFGLSRHRETDEVVEWEQAHGV